MKFIILLFAIALSPICFGQADTINPKMLEFDHDSCHLTVWDIAFKESSLPNDNIYRSRVRAHSKLSKTHSMEVLSALKDSNSYDGVRALLDHYDIVLRFFHLGEVVVRVEVSAMTGNITIYTNSNEYYFRNNSSTSFGDFFIGILNEYDIIERAEYDEIHLTGLLLDNSN